MNAIVTVSRKIIWTAVAVFVIVTIFSFSTGWFYNKNKPCKHVKPYEVETTGQGIMLVVPQGWFAVPVLNKHGRPYMRPTDEEG